MVLEGGRDGVPRPHRTTSSTHSKCTRSRCPLVATAGAAVRPWALRRPGAVHLWGRTAAHREGQACRHGALRLATRAIPAGHRGGLDRHRQEATAGAVHHRGLARRTTRPGKAGLQVRAVSITISRPRLHPGVAASAAAHAIVTELGAALAARTSHRLRRPSARKRAERRALKGPRAVETGAKIGAVLRVQTETETATETETGTGEVEKPFHAPMPTARAQYVCDFH